MIYQQATLKLHTKTVWVDLTKNKSWSLMVDIEQYIAFYKPGCSLDGVGSYTRYPCDHIGAWGENEISIYMFRRWKPFELEEV